MVQAADLGAIPNQSRTLYRGRVNVGFQAVASNNYGATTPNPTYPGMIWFDSGNNLIKIRNSANTSWYTSGVISGNTYTWTNLPPYPTVYWTGMIMPTIAHPSNTGYWPDGWILLNNGTIGGPSSGATNRANNDCWLLYNLLWYNIDRAYSYIFLSNTTTTTSFGANSTDDWNLSKHILLPRFSGRLIGNCAGVEPGVTSARSIGAFAGQETTTVTLAVTNMPAHNHNLQRSLPNYVAGKSSNSGGFTLADQSSGISTTEVSGSGQPFTISTVPPSVFVNWMIKL